MPKPKKTHVHKKSNKGGDTEAVKAVLKMIEARDLTKVFLSEIPETKQEVEQKGMSKLEEDVAEVMGVSKKTVKRYRQGKVSDKGKLFPTITKEEYGFSKMPATALDKTKKNLSQFSGKTRTVKDNSKHSKEYSSEPLKQQIAASKEEYNTGLISVKKVGSKTLLKLRPFAVRKIGRPEELQLTVHTKRGELTNSVLDWQRLLKSPMYRSMILGDEVADALERYIAKLLGKHK